MRIVAVNVSSFVVVFGLIALTACSSNSPAAKVSSPTPPTLAQPTSTPTPTAAATDDVLAAATMLPPAVGCIAYAPGIDDAQGINRIPYRGALIVKAAVGDSVALVLHLPRGDRTLRAVSNSRGDALFDIDLRDYTSGIDRNFDIVADATAQGSTSEYHCATSFHAGG